MYDHGNSLEARRLLLHYINQHTTGKRAAITAVCNRPTHPNRTTNPNVTLDLTIK